MKKILYSAASALLAMSLTMQASYADCESNKRVDYDDSYCLDGSISDNNGNVFRKSSWTLRNLCSRYPVALKFKVDLVARSDVNYMVAGGGNATGSSAADIRNVACCKDSAPSIDGSNSCTFATKADYDRAVDVHCAGNTSDERCPD